MTHTGLFRVRRGWLGKCILQECLETPSLIGGHVDASVRDIWWEDVSYDRAPRALVSQFREELKK